MRNSLVAIAFAAFTAVVAQNDTIYTIDPNKVQPGDRNGWCNAQYNTCNTLCANNPKTDDCDPAKLTYHCTCQNGSEPGLIYYTQSLPTFICEKNFDICNTAAVGNAAGQRACNETIRSKCGTLDPNKAAVGGGATTSASGSGTPTGSGSTTSPTRNAAPANLQHFGNGAAAVALGLLAYML